MIGQISQPQRSAPAEGGAIQPQLRHTTSSLAGYDAVVDRYAASEAGPHVGDSATSVGGAPMPEFEDRQLLTSRSRGPGSGGLLIGQSASLGGGRPVGAALGAASPFEMGRMSQGALDRVNQARCCSAEPPLLSEVLHFLRHLAVCSGSAWGWACVAWLACMALAKVSRPSGRV